MREIRYENAGSRERQDTGIEDLQMIAKYRMALCGVPVIRGVQRRTHFSLQKISMICEKYQLLVGFGLRMQKFGDGNWRI